jgi:hypothetical protein
LVDLLDPRKQIEAEQAGDREPDLRLAVRVDVVAFERHRGALTHGALNHRGDLRGSAANQLGVDDHRLLLDVPVDQDAAAAVARVPLGEQVLVISAEVRGVRRHGRGALPPDLGLPRRERRIGELDRDGASAVDREVPPRGVAQVSLAVAVVAAGGGADTGVGAVCIGDQQQALPEHRARERFA